ncbi:hypothetical protein EGW08_007350, partial [Elysia chlorotica]
CGPGYLLWRIFWAAYHSAWLVAGPVLAATDAVHTAADGAVGVDDDAVGGSGGTDSAAAAAGKWFIYLSHWVYLLLTVQCVTEAALLAVVGKRRMPENLEAPVVWLFSTISSTGSVMICLWYWTKLHTGKELTGARVNTHGVAALYCILDLLVSQKPFRLMHAPYPIVFGATYTAFSALYYIAGGRGKHGSPVIYSVLDWSTPWKTLAISSISNFVVIPLVHSTLWGLGLVFEALGERWQGGRQGGRADESREKDSSKTVGYDIHVDTETSSCGRTNSIAGTSRSSRTIEDL